MDSINTFHHSKQTQDLAANKQNDYNKEIESGMCTYARTRVLGRGDALTWDAIIN